MFAKLTGKIDSLFQDSLILDVGGVGYHVCARGRTLGLIGDCGSPVSLLIETHVREDHIHLYGFSSLQERRGQNENCWHVPCGADARKPPVGPVLTLPVAGCG